MTLQLAIPSPGTHPAAASQTHASLLTPVTGSLLHVVVRVPTRTRPDEKKTTRTHQWQFLLTLLLLNVDTFSSCDITRQMGQLRLFHWPLKTILSLLGPQFICQFSHYIFSFQLITLPPLYLLKEKKNKRGHKYQVMHSFTIPFFFMLKFNMKYFTIFMQIR